MRSPEERRAEVVRAEAAWPQPKFLFFWKERVAPAGALGPGCLSQFWPAPFVIDGLAYPTAEHWMMVQKARLFKDEGPLPASWLPAPPKPSRPPVGGCTVSPSFIGLARYRIVVAGNMAKFSQHVDLRGYLLSTGNRVLVEASPLDRVWGIGLAADDDRATSPSRWGG